MKRKTPSGARSKSKDAIAEKGDLSAATRTSYEESWALFVEWCGKFGRPTEPGASDRSCADFAEQIVDFLHDEYLRDLSISTLSLRRAAIAWKLRGSVSVSRWKSSRLRWSSKSEKPNPAKMDVVVDYLRGLKKEIATAPRQAKRLYPEQIEVACAVACKPRRTPARKGFESEDEARVRGVEDRAILSLLFYGAMRRSEVSNLRWRAVRFVSGEGERMAEIVVEKAKNNPVGTRLDRRRLPDPACERIDALRALRDPMPDDPLFPSSKRPGEGLSGDRLNVRMKEALHAAGFFGHSSHSGRVGLATLMAERGFTDLQIAQTGDWLDLKTVKRYTDARSETTMPVVDLVRSLKD